MEDNHLPSADFDFIAEKLRNHPNLEKEIFVGDTVAFVFKGKGSIARRLIELRRTEDNLLDFNKATGVAGKAGFLLDLIEWFKDNKDWKDGGYTNGSN